MIVSSNIIKRERYQDSTIYTFHILVDGSSVSEEVEGIVQTERELTAEEIASVMETSELTEVPEGTVVIEEHIELKNQPVEFAIQVSDGLDAEQELKDYLISYKASLQAPAAVFIQNQSV